jgi:hypothetical protein
VLPGTDPRDHLQGIVRMQGSTREEDVPWWFTGVIFAVTGTERDSATAGAIRGHGDLLVPARCDGYLLGGNTVTFFRDFETGEYLREFRNPWTGRRRTL